MSAPLRVLTYSTLYPNSVQIRHGIFVEQRLRHLLASGAVESTVMAPVPWFPSRHPRFGVYAEFARVPAGERRHGVEVLHPRYPVIPKIGMHLAPTLLARATARPLRELRRRFPFQLIDAHYFYPDGVAAAELGRRLDVPVVITARGSDLLRIGEYPAPRRRIVRAANAAAGVITVAGALKQRLVDFGVDGDRVRVLRNGVDLNLFHPGDRAAQRAALGVGDDRRLLLSVGLLRTMKGHDLTLRALALLPSEYHLVIVGDGAERRTLQRLRAELGLERRVRFVGTQKQQALKDFYGAADALVLSSKREGMANVLLESMACGTPAVATPVGGTPEVIVPPESGVLVEERTPEAVAAAVRRLFAALPDRAATRRYAETFGWDSTTQGQLALFRDILAGART